MKITLSGFGDFSENPEGEEALEKSAKAHGIEFYPTYYDHELKGERDAIECITKDLWGMKSDEWAENALYETKID